MTALLAWLPGTWTRWRTARRHVGRHATLPRPREDESATEWLSRTGKLADDAEQHLAGMTPETPAPAPPAGVQDEATTPQVAASEVPAPPVPPGAGASPTLGDLVQAAPHPLQAGQATAGHAPTEPSRAVPPETAEIPIPVADPPLRLRLYADPRWLMAGRGRTLARDIAATMVAADIRSYPGEDSACCRHPELAGRLAELTARRRELAGVA